MNAMPDITIQDQRSRITTDDPTELTRFVQSSVALGSNTLYISRTGHPLPALIVMITNSYAVVYFLPDDDTAGYRSFEPALDVEGEPELDFFDHFSEEPLHIVPGNNAVIEASRVVGLALEFARTNGLPTGIEWFEL